MRQTDDIREYKRSLRARCKQERATLDEGQKRQLDEAIFANFLSMREYNECRLLLAYVSMDIEVDTHLLIDRALSDGKKVAVPYCKTDSHMEFYYINSMDELVPSTFGVLEPEPQPERICKAEKLDEAICIVPALCFDCKGYRLGFGKGYYDRFLSRFSAISIGLAYSFQMRKSLRKSQYDRPVDIVVTDEKIQRIKTS